MKDMVQRSNWIFFLIYALAMQKENKFGQVSSTKRKIDKSN